MSQTWLAACVSRHLAIVAHGRICHTLDRIAAYELWRSLVSLIAPQTAVIIHAKFHSPAAAPRSRRRRRLAQCTSVTGIQGLAGHSARHKSDDHAGRSRQHHRSARSSCGLWRFDGVWSSHNIEHLYAHEVPLALGEMPHPQTGWICPHYLPRSDPGRASAVAGRPRNTVDPSPAGPINVLDILYGHTASITAGNSYMAHNTGFTQTRLGNVLQQAGFAEAWVGAGPKIDLWAVALMPHTDRDRLRGMFKRTPEAFLAGT